MSFVGPRPLSVDDLKQIKKQFPSDYNKREQLKIKPGITGYWQINKDRFGDISYLIESDKYIFLIGVCKELRRYFPNLIVNLFLWF